MKIGLLFILAVLIYFLTQMQFYEKDSFNHIDTWSKSQNKVMRVFIK